MPQIVAGRTESMTGASFARWRGSPNHYSGRNGYAISHITLHIMVGRLAGTDSCFRRAVFQAASHYGVGSDGTIYQWVDEANGSWADANWQSDCSGITIEHEGGMAGIPVTDAAGGNSSSMTLPAIAPGTCGCTARCPAPTISDARTGASTGCRSIGCSHALTRYSAEPPTQPTMMRRIRCSASSSPTAKTGSSISTGRSSTR